MALMGGGAQKKFNSQQYRVDLEYIDDLFANLYQTQMSTIAQYQSEGLKRLDELVSTTVPGATEMFRQATGFYQKYSDTVVPAIEQNLNQAMDYGSESRVEQARSRAMADTVRAGELSRQAAQTKLQQFGVDPSMLRDAALDQEVRTQAALAAVQAGNKAANDQEETGAKMRESALSTASSLATEGRAGVGMAGDVLTNNAATTGNLGQIFANLYGNAGATTLGSRANITTTQAGLKAQEQASKSEGGGQAAQIGQLAGTVIGGVAGAYFGGPMGAQAGMAAGGALGGAAGGAAGG